MSMLELLHPLLQRLRAPFATRPIERLATAIVSAIEAEYRGIVAYGLARFGKSWAVKYLTGNASWIRGPFFTARLSIPKSHKRTEGAFFSLWLARFSMALPERSTPMERMERLRNYLIAKCDEHGTDLAVIFLDEAQRLFPDDYEHLVSLDNDMTDFGYVLFVVFVVQSDFSGTAMEKIYDGNPPPHVRGRFLTRKHEFGGLNGIDEIDHALGRMDEHTEWPAGSARSYSCHFAPGAFEEGWRFRQHAAQLYQRAVRLRLEHGLSGAWTWPMKSFEVCINFLLTNIAGPRTDFSGFTDEDIDQALQASGFIELERSRGMGLVEE
ncbi:ATP-binding protein [Pseudoxanthomonas sp.]|uniref:ATP-binding protein n=1 Tax=Pseudoxanthomonas sp. TaxID=1871049 RepID=UPI002590CE57|nr:ATP-binding protein [Pseudoxanthomonas sp.]MCR6686996.1 ATP-binding protein [Pseudoxanthomonas sp.]